MKERHYQRISGIFDAEIADGERVILDARSSRYFDLNSVASRIWELLAVPVAAEQVCDRLVQEFDIEREACRQQVGEFLDRLIEKGLCQAVDD